MNIFELFGKIELDTSGYQKGIQAIINQGNSAAKIFESMGKSSETLAKAAAAAAAAAAAVGAAFSTVVGASVKNYAEYEQLVGGVETLFGAGGKSIEEYAKSVGKSVSEASAEYDKLMLAQEKVFSYAENAYTSAGMSANDYMSNITAFSASLISSLGGDTVAAAEVANMAISDMSDNSNKMGTDIEYIVQTYQSLARGNYAMLDNLKLGYGGTKSELERLLSDAEAYKASMGETADYSVNSFADIVEAIHVVQDQMGITGTTALEASTTIEGSLNSAKAAWQNLLTGFADSDQDLGELIDRFVESVVVASENILPRIAETVPRVIEGIGTLIQEAIPHLMEYVKGIWEGIPSMIESFGNLLLENAPILFEYIASLVSSIGEAISTNLPQILNKGVELINNLVNGIISGIPVLLQNLPQIIQNIVSFFATNASQIIQAGAKILGNLVRGIVSAIPQIVASAPTIIGSFIGAIISNLPQVISAGLSIISNLASGVLSGIGDIISAAGEVVNAAISEFEGAVSELFNIGAELINGLWEGISSKIEWVKQKVSGFADSVISTFKRVFQIFSPSRVTKEDGKNLALGLIAGLEEKKELTGKKAEEVAQIVLDAAEEKLSEYKNINDLSIQDEVDYWKTIVECTESGTDARIKAEEKYYTALKSFKQQHEDYVNSIMNQVSLFSEFTRNESVTGQDLISNLFSQVSGIESYTKTLQELEGKIGGTALFEELKNKGIGSISELEAINSLNASRLDYYVSLYDQKASAVEKLSPYSEAVTNYNFTFNSPSALSASEARRESTRAYNNMVLGY